jgi:hypothetical protein
MSMVGTFLLADTCGFQSCLDWRFGPSQDTFGEITCGGGFMKGLNPRFVSGRTCPTNAIPTAQS